MGIESTSFIIMEDGLRAKNALSDQIYEGQPVSLNSSGKLVAATATSKVYGLSKIHSNQYQDLAWAGDGSFGSGQLAVINAGILTLSQNVFNQVEINSSMTTASVPVTVKVFDDAQVYAVGDALYVDVNGLISNVSAGGKESLLGKVLRTPAQLGGQLELELNCTLPSTSAAALA